MPAPVNLSQNVPLSPQLAQRLALTPGTLVDARVVDIKGQQVTLQLNQQILTARTELSLQPGQQYTFKVQFQNGQWQLRLQPDNPSTMPSNRLSLPVPSLPPQQALAQLSSLLTSANTTGSLAALAPLITQLNKALIKEVDQLNGKTLPGKLKNSGVLLENRLAKGERPLQDIKGMLLSLLRQLPKAQKSEAHALQALLRHIEQHQLNNLNNDWFGFPLWFAPQSPISHAQVWVRPPSPEWEARTNWQALLQLDLKHSGLLEVLICWQPETPLAVHFWTPNPLLRQRLEKTAEVLKEELGEATITFSDQPLANTAQPVQSIQVKA